MVASSFYFGGAELMGRVDVGTAEECLEHPFFDGMYDVGGGQLGPRSPLYT